MNCLDSRIYARLFLSLLLIVSVLTAPFARAQRREFGMGGPVIVHIDPKTGAIDIRWSDGAGIHGIASSATLADGKTITSSDYVTHTVVADAAATHELTVRHSMAGLPAMIQHVWLRSGKPWVEIQAELDGDAAQTGTRHFDTFVVKGGTALELAHNEPQHALHVPYDNDMWFRFNSEALTGSDQHVLSSEVTAVYENASRGFVLGSITHDTWKTSLDLHAQNGDVDGLDIFGGLQGSLGERTDTHDFVPHGIVRGTKVLSPRVMVGEFADWRDGLEAYGKRNAELHPPLAWAGPRPLGWNSWAAYADKINHQRFVESARFVHDKLEPEGFSRKVIYINFDAFWSNLDGVALADASASVSAMKSSDGTKFVPGIYWTPFAAWTDNLDALVDGTNGKYRYRDILLKGSDGNFLPKVDGGRPIDPTHPGARMRTAFTIAKLQQLGYQYLKLDFPSHWALEGAHYDPAIQTGTEAYNLGMRDVLQANAGRMYLSLSIAPLFPAGYGNARRLSCDTKGHINGKDQSTEYMLNALTYAWWTDGSLYTTDPDHVPLGDKADQGARNLTEARSRLLSTIISGGMILDSSRLADDPEGQRLATDVYSNRALMKVANEGKIFRPLEGDTGDQAANVFVRPTVRGYYLAVFNFDDKIKHAITVNLDRIARHFIANSAHDLASGNESGISGGKLVVELAPAESRLIELTGGTPQ
jgi:alpha-galactosidase